MLLVAQDYNLYSFQLRIIRLMVDHNDVSHSLSELSRIVNQAWVGLVENSLTLKITPPDLEAPERFQNHILFKDYNRFIQKVKKFRRIVEGTHPYKIELFNLKLLFREMMDQT